MACDLSTNTCTTPKTTCADLGAECGVIKNTCGVYLDCPDGNPKGCPDGKECDPDTNKCRDCQQVTCKDLGYECGFAWLGCGPNDSAHQTDCGTCAAGSVCNNSFNICEPKCTPLTPKEICDAAHATAKGVECGSISDGCGGIVNCDTVPGYGCAAGQGCGVHGLPNRCDAAETPDECLAEGRQCGTIKSACGGKTVTCGTCPTGQVCNDNGICGAPCTPKTCADFTGFACGTFDDACGGKVTCGTCAGGVCDQTTNTCCTNNTCAATYAGKCGTSLALGCGTGTLNCACSGTEKCTADSKDDPAPAPGTPGACCTPKTAASYAGQCGTKLSNGCGGTIDVNCAAGLYCVDNPTGAVGNAPAAGVAGTCCTPTGKCNTEAAGTCAPIANSCRPDGQPQQTCDANCVAPKSTCANNTCCAPAALCTGSGAVGGECNITHPANGCGSDRTCNCNAGLTCTCGADNHVCTAADGAGTCKAALTCGGLAAGACGTGISNGVGGTIDCGCGTGHICSTTTPGVIGTCECANGTANPYTCANVPSGPGQPGGDACGSFPNGCGGTVTCNCTAGLTCNQTPNPNVCCQGAAACAGGGGDGAECNVTHSSGGCGPDNVCTCAGARACWCTDHACTAADGPGTCKSPLTCSSPGYQNKCGTGLDNGIGGKINCGCTAGHACTTTTTGALGQCQCANGTNAPYNCNNVPNGPGQPGGDACGSFSDGCGGTLTCNCSGSGKVCYTTPNPNTCCTPLTCPASPGVGTMCGNGIDNTCGGKINCSCPSGANNTNWTCTAGTCQCVKNSCAGLNGLQPDGCGGQQKCSG
jgi:hypothetical protein